VAAFLAFALALTGHVIDANDDRLIEQ